MLKFQVSEIQNNWANFTQTLHKTVKKFVQMKNHAIQEKDILKTQRRGGHFKNLLKTHRARNAELYMELFVIVKLPLYKNVDP